MTYTYTYRCVFHWRRAKSIMLTSYVYSCVVESMTSKTSKSSKTYKFHVPAGTPETVEIMARLHAMLGGTHGDATPGSIPVGRLLQRLSLIKSPWTHYYPKNQSNGHDKEAVAELLRAVTRAAAGSGRRS